MNHELLDIQDKRKGKKTEMDQKEQDALMEEQKASQRLAEVQFFLGINFFEQGKFQEAVDSFSRAVQHIPHAYVYDWLGVSLFELGKFTDAEKAYQQALEQCGRIPGDRSPDLPSVLKNYAILLRRLGRISEAELLDRRLENIPVVSQMVGPAPSKKNPIRRFFSHLKHTVLR